LVERTRGGGEGGGRGKGSERVRPNEHRTRTKTCGRLKDGSEGRAERRGRDGDLAHPVKGRGVKEGEEGRRKDGGG